MINNIQKIVISRTDSIGDVVLTLPLTGLLKEKYPNAHLIFLGNTYTKPILDCDNHIDEVWEWANIKNWSKAKQVSWLKEQDVDVFIHVFPNKEIAKLAKSAKIRHRIGTSHRAYNWFTCNHRPSFTRKNSDLHEAQLNVNLLIPLGIEPKFEKEELFEFINFQNKPDLPEKFRAILSKEKRNLVLHCKSQGSAVEWGVDRFIELAKTLDSEKFEIFFTGTEKEAVYFREKLPEQENIHDLSGKMTLDQLITFIAQSDILVAASTGPLHIAGVAGINAIGLFSSVRPIHPGRWQPLGNKVKVLKDTINTDFTQPLQIDLRDVKKAIESCEKK